MNKKNKRNLKKKLAPVALCGLIVVGASAWLTNKEVATGVNKITVGTTELVFADVEDGKTRDDSTITISGSKVIPMTEAYANENLDPYVFSLNNTGSMELEYTIYLVCDEYSFGELNRGTEEKPSIASALNLDTNGSTNTFQKITARNAGEKQSVYSGTLAKGEKKDFTNWIIFVDERATTANTQTEVNGVITPATAKYHLEVEAHQKTPDVSYSYQLVDADGDLIDSFSVKNAATTSIRSAGPELSEFKTGLASSGKWADGGPHLIWSESEGLIYADYNNGDTTAKYYVLYKDAGMQTKFTVDDVLSAGTITVYKATENSDL